MPTFFATVVIAQVKLAKILEDIYRVNSGPNFDLNPNEMIRLHFDVDVVFNEQIMAYARKQESREKHGTLIRNQIAIHRNCGRDCTPPVAKEIEPFIVFKFDMDTRSQSYV